MKSILTLKKLYYNDHISKLNPQGKTEEEMEKARKRCQSVAEVRAFIDTLIDEEHRNLSIFNFTGKTRSGQMHLDTKEALRAKNLVCKFIWGYSWSDLKNIYKTEDNIKKYISRNSVLMRRLKNGNNVAIYGGLNGACGRTMIASIIMKEVIKMRLFTPDIVSQTYDWVDFQTLISSLRENTIEVPDYRTADWLVVDNIYVEKGESRGSRAYRSGLLDPFFMYRLKNNLPTILVFQYDIRSGTEALYRTLGIGISSIVNSPRICRIPLNKRS